MHLFKSYSISYRKYTCSNPFALPIGNPVGFPLGNSTRNPIGFPIKNLTGFHMDFLQVGIGNPIGGNPIGFHRTDWKCTCSNPIDFL